MAEYLLLIAGMALVTYVPRIAPLVLFSSRTLHPMIMRWLAMIPPAVLAALLAPELLLHTVEGEKHLFFSMDNIFLLAALPTIQVGWLSKSFFSTVAAGMACVALLRFFAF